tara:strand:+ start:142 stop:456 length:315 start_codon:yes stop_codon:yes gene_type:complete
MDKLGRFDMARNLIDRINGDPAENSIYQDNGCGHGCEKSLECPFEKCILDIATSEQIGIREQRNLLIRSTWMEEKCNIDQIASRFKLSRRTIHRILAQKNNLDS